MDKQKERNSDPLPRGHSDMDTSTKDLSMKRTKITYEFLFSKGDSVYNLIEPKYKI